MKFPSAKTQDLSSLEISSDKDVTRRSFLGTGTCAVGAAIVPTSIASAFSRQPIGGEKMPFKVPPLSYDFSALEPFIDAKTMEIHHDMHHAAYVKNLNAALDGQTRFQEMSVFELLTKLSSLPDSIRAAVRNNAGGHANHSLFWKLLKKNNGAGPTGTLADKIKADFGSFEQFKTLFQDAGTKLFGSGWVFLVVDPKSHGKLKIQPMPNQDSVLSEGLSPVLGNDVWEHAYYLQYQNRRADYLANWWNVVNWEYVGKRYEAIESGVQEEIA